MEHIEPTNETPPDAPQPRKTLAEAVGQEVGALRQAAEMDAFDEAAVEAPAFDKRSGTSNFGKRVSARLQHARQ
jgi:hypothetical protein